MTADVGFLVAAGDACSLGDASCSLARGADHLDEHADNVHGAAASVGPFWAGIAAAAYHEVSSAIAADFRDAACASRTAASALSRHSIELDRCQREGRTATSEAERLLQEIATQTRRLHAAEQAASAAQSALSAAHAPGVGVLAGAAAAARAMAGMASAQADEQAARSAIASAREELEQWRARGRAAWQDAQTAGEQSAATVETLRPQAPPIPTAAAIPAAAMAAPRRSPGLDRLETPVGRYDSFSPVPGGAVAGTPAAPLKPAGSPRTQPPSTVAPASHHHGGGADLPTPRHDQSGSGTTTVGGPSPSPRPAGHKPSKPDQGTGTTTITWTWTEA